MDNNVVITYLACILFLFVLGRVFIVPLKMIVKIIFKAVKA